MWTWLRNLLGLDKPQILTEEQPPAPPRPVDPSLNPDISLVSSWRRAAPEKKDKTATADTTRMPSTPAPKTMTCVRTSERARTASTTSSHVSDYESVHRHEYDPMTDVLTALVTESILDRDNDTSSPPEPAAVISPPPPAEPMSPPPSPPASYD
jgi:hypothetical protein